MQLKLFAHRDLRLIPITKGKAPNVLLAIDTIGTTDRVSGVNHLLHIEVVKIDDVDPNHGSERLIAFAGFELTAQKLGKVVQGP